MGSISNKIRMGHHHGAPLCTRTHQIGALLLISATFFLTRLLDHSTSCSPALPSPISLSGDPPDWPHRGYGPRLSLKIYVYEEAEVAGLRELMRGHDGAISPDDCVRGQWGTQVISALTRSLAKHLSFLFPWLRHFVEHLVRVGRIQVKIHRLLVESRFRTRDKGEADLFFVPAYVKCVRMKGGLNDKEINQTYVQVLSQMPHFRKSGGRDHVFVFPSGAGAHLFRSWATFINRSIILTPEGDRTDKKDTTAFNTWKDIIIPGNINDEMTKKGNTLVQPLPLSKRKYLANYLGRAQGKVGRLKLIELAKQYPNKLESPELKLTGTEKYGPTEYFQHLRNAKFCLAPRGESSWTLRFYESFFVECVPVILSDQAEFPFQNVIDYTKISIKWPSTRIGPELLEYLESIPDEDIERMIANGRQVRCLWVYAPESEPCSAMLGILWELQRKVRQFHQSAETFWLHNGTIVNKNLVEFSRWKPPMPMP